MIHVHNSFETPVGFASLFEKHKCGKNSVHQIRRAVRTSIEMSLETYFKVNAICLQQKGEGADNIIFPLPSSFAKLNFPLQWQRNEDNRGTI